MTFHRTLHSHISGKNFTMKDTWCEIWRIFPLISDSETGTPSFNFKNTLVDEHLADTEDTEGQLVKQQTHRVPYTSFCETCKFSFTASNRSMY